MSLNDVKSYNIAVRLPEEFGQQRFKNIKEQWDAEGEVALNFLPQLRHWLEVRGYLNAADSLYHVFSHYLVIECDAELATYIKYSGLSEVGRVVEEPYKRQQNLYVV